MPSLVMDASFVLALIMPDEADPPEHGALSSAREEAVAVPMLWWTEVGHAVMLAVRHERMTEAERREGLARLRGMAIETDPDGYRAAWDRTTDLAVRHRLSLYDATYLELALRLGARLATLDRAMRRAAAEEGIPLLPA
jgi:predicted nucleic acid-binding protein